MVTTKQRRRLGAIAVLALSLTTSGLVHAQEPPPEEVVEGEAQDVPDGDAEEESPTADGAPEDADRERAQRGEAQQPQAPKEQDGGGAQADGPAAATTGAAEAGDGLAIHHAPPAVATVDEPLTLRMDIEHAERVEGAFLVYRLAEGDYREIPFRWGAGGYVAVIPAEQVQAPGLVYTVELKLVDGRRLAAFASRELPHAVQVSEDGMDLIEDALSERLDDRRNVFFSSGEYVSFGTSTATFRAEDGSRHETDVHDSYYRIEGGYSHRPLRTINEFSFRIGVVRGTAPVPVRPLVPGQDKSERFNVGLNYGGTSVRFRLGEIWYLDGSLLASVTEVGFSAGTGMALHIGDPYASQLVLGFEAIQSFGARFFSQVDILAHERVRVSPIIEVTNMPSADEFGVRLLGELGVDIGAGFAAAARGGYQARQATSGGPSVGGTVSYAF